MQFLSKQIEAHARKRKQEVKSLIKKEHSCGIFQDYDSVTPIDPEVDHGVQI